jgi:hypothetical protein
MPADIKRMRLTSIFCSVANPLFMRSRSASSSNRSTSSGSEIRCTLCQSRDRRLQGMSCTHQPLLLLVFSHACISSAILKVERQKAFKLWCVDMSCALLPSDTRKIHHLDTPFRARSRQTFALCALYPTRAAPTAWQQQWCTCALCSANT